MKKTCFLVLAAMIFLFTSCDKLKNLGDGSGDFHPPFTVISISPLEGEPGTVVTIRGIGFSKDSLKNEVKVNGTLAHIRNSSDTTLQAIIPETNTVSANITVLVNNVSSQHDFMFNYYDVYVTGRVWNSNKSFARLWKNGIAQPYPDTTFRTATRIFHDGNDIYFGTNEGYFKNTTYVKLNANLGFPSNVSSVVLNNGDVYASFTGGYFKNGIFKKLGIQLNDIAFNKDTMYVTSFVQGPGLLFKNGVEQNLQYGDRHASANVVAIHGNEVHVGGHNDEHATFASEWVNGNFYPLNGYNEVYDIFFNGNDEYMAVSNAYEQSLYLKNGVPVKLPEPKIHFSGSSITAINNNVYVAGGWTNAPIVGVFDINPSLEVIPSYTVEAVYYRNGIKIVLPRSTFQGAMANSLLVLKR